MLIAKYKNKYVRIARIADSVAFSDDRGWVLIEFNLELPEHKRQHRKWVRSTTRFEWVRKFS